MLVKSVLVCVTFLTAVGQCTESPVMVPYERTSIDDCQVRLFKNITLKISAAPAFGGSAVLLGEFAHIAAIGWTQQNGTVRWLCGGSLIWENFILTAAHCAADESTPPMPPDQARMGDINIYSDEDDEFAQQLKIVKVIKHPKYRFGVRYYDIALMKLETKIRKTVYVAPICLWLDDEIPFPRLLAAGWGNTAFDKGSSEVLLQVELSLVNNTECAKHHKGGGIALRNGIQDHQICAVDPAMDLCRGDSGGPLLVNLHSYFGVYTPFLVGITSFGKPCGHSIPGVFVKVSKFKDWIFQKLKFYGHSASPNLFEPFKCARRYNFQYSLEYFMHQSSKYRSIRYIDASDDYIVSLQWPAAAAPMRCSGTLIEPNIVLTLAQCASYQGVKPDRVVFSDSTEMKIRDIIVHPNYTELAKYHNNLAVLRLESFAPTAPACGWYEENFPKNNIKIHGYDAYNTLIQVQSLITPQTDCNMVQRYSSLFPHGLQDEHMCFKDELFLVPNSCNLQLGASINNKITDYASVQADDVPKYSFVWGLNMLGQDCGYGTPAVGVRLGAHKAWLESVLLPRSKGNEAFVHVDPDLDVSDECRYADGTKGECTAQQNCPAIHARVQNNQQLLFCKDTAVVCCPGKATSPESIAIENEFNECEERYRHLRTGRQQDTSHIVEIGWQEAENATYDCYGYLISTRGVVSSASCLLGKAVLPNIVRLGGLGESDNSETILIEKVVIHPRYNATTQRHNIAIVKLGSAAKPSEQVFPGCLWQNFTHSPLLQKVYDFDSNKYYSIHPMYQSDCESVADGPMQAPEMACMNPGWIEYSVIYTDYLTYTLQKWITSQDISTICFQSGNPVIWRNVTQNATYTEYLIHIYNYGECDENSYRFVERVAMYIDWFKTVLV